MVKLARHHSVSAAHPNQSSVFVTISAERSRDILGPAVWKLNQIYGTGITEKRGDGHFEWPNGYKLLYRGCKDVNECNKRRGTPWVMADWDEAASINNNLLQYDIHECVEPRLADFNGIWSVGGTPGPIQTGYWWKLCEGALGYPVFSWDARHNTHMPNVAKFFVETLQRMSGVPERALWPEGATSIMDIINDEKSWKLLPSAFVREYLGKWVLDLRALIYKITPKNTYAELPIDPDYWTIGCDLGSHSDADPDLDHAAISVACSNKTLPYIWVPESRKYSNVNVTTLAAQLCQLIERYPQASVHLDNSSAGNLILATFKKMGIPIQAAVRSHKLRRIQLVQSAIETGDLQLHIRDTMDLRHEATALVWNDERDSHSERCADDAWDSLLYAALPHFGEYRPEALPPEPGTKEWLAAQELAEYEDALRRTIEGEA